MLSQLSDPLRRKVYDPKILTQENTNDERVAPINDKVSQLSLTFRKEAIFAAKDANSEDGIEDDNIALYTLESSQVNTNQFSLNHNSKNCKIKFELGFKQHYY